MSEEPTRSMHLGRTGALLALSLLAFACSDGSGRPFQLVAEASTKNDATSQFGAVPDGVTDNEPMLQAALDHAAASGGATVYLPAGTYAIARPLIVGSNTQLVGDGPGRTVLRALVPNWGKTAANGAGITAAVSMVAADGSSVRDLTVDLSFASTHSNGVTLQPAGADNLGTPSTNCEVSNIEVIGAGDYHAYMIWNFRGRDIRIVHNTVDGRVQQYTPGSGQEGIESYGGENVLIAWNTISNIGNAALNFGSAGLDNTSIDGLEVISNVVTNAAIGLNIGTAMGATGPQNILNVNVMGNEFTNVWQTGMYVPVQAHTEMRGLHITDNHLRNVGSAQTSGTGFYLQTYAADAATSDAISDNIVQGNVVESVRGSNAIGVLVVQFPNLLVANNTVREVANTGVVSISADNLTVQGNSITDIDLFAVQSYGSPASVYVRDNTFRSWNRLRQGVAGVSINDVSAGDVRGNAFEPIDVSSSVVNVAPGAANVVVFGNTVITPTGALSGWPMVPGVPLFVNDGANSNLGSFAATSGLTTLSVTHPLVQPTSKVAITQVAGAPLAVAAAPAAGAFEVTFGAAPLGGEVFNYEIDP